MAKQFTSDDDALLAELGVEAKVAKTARYTPRQERIIAGFEEVQRFVQQHGRAPRHGEDGDIFERLYAVRLDQLRASEECRALLAEMDTDGLLQADAELRAAESATDEELLAALGAEEASGDVSQLQHVRSRAEINAAEEVAQRTTCEDFASFEAAFQQVQAALESGERGTAKYRDNAAVRRGDWFILEGQKVLVAEVGDEFVAEYGKKDRRLRVVYDNGTESDLLLRSLQRALNKDDSSRRILSPDADALPLFADEMEADDAQSGSIYVVRSMSDHPFVAEHRSLIHKIGVTGQDVNSRIAHARKDPTYLLADVELVESFSLANINRQKLERLLHQFFAEARIDVQLRDRFDQPVQPREWFFVPLNCIVTAVELLTSGEIEHCRYDHGNAQIIDTRTDQPWG